GHTHLHFQPAGMAYKFSQLFKSSAGILFQMVGRLEVLESECDVHICLLGFGGHTLCVSARVSTTVYPHSLSAHRVCALPAPGLSHLGNLERGLSLGGRGNVHCSTILRNGP